MYIRNVALTLTLISIIFVLFCFLSVSDLNQTKMRIDRFMDEYESKYCSEAEKRFHDLISSKGYTRGWMPILDGLSTCMVVPNDDNTRVAVHGLDYTAEYEIDWLEVSGQKDILFGAYEDENKSLESFDEGFATMFKIKGSSDIIACANNVVKFKLDYDEKLIVPRIQCWCSGKVYENILFTTKGVFAASEWTKYVGDKYVYEKSYIEDAVDDVEAFMDLENLFFTGDDTPQGIKSEILYHGRTSI